MTEGVLIKEVTSRAERLSFLRFPKELYKNHPFWVPSIDMVEKKLLSTSNPSFAASKVKCWMAYKNGAVVGRIAGIINPAEIKCLGKPIARFGWLDFIDDAQISQILFQTFFDWIKNQNITEAHGPMGFTDLDKNGMLVEGFDQLGTAATLQNYPYYRTHLERIGFEKKIDWVEYKFVLPKQVPEKLERLSNLIQKKYNLSLGSLQEKKKLARLGPDIFSLLNTCYKDLYGFVPISNDQALFYSDLYLKMIKTEYISLVFDDQKKLIAFGIALPSLSRALQKSQGALLPLGFLHILKAFRSPSCADLALIAIHPRWQRKGVHSLIFNEITRALIRHGVYDIETNPELETNKAVHNIWSVFNPRLHKRRRCFSISLDFAHL